MNELVVKSITGLVGAAFGYGVKNFSEWLKARRSSRVALRARLLQLTALVEESRSLYFVQSFLAIQLYNLIQTNHGDAIAGLNGYDNVFRAVFKELTPAEAELHAYIRSLTVNSVNRLHENLRLWLDANLVELQSALASQKLSAILNDLTVLRTHLNEWTAQYRGLFEADPGRAVNFVSSHVVMGTRFPNHLLGRLKQFLEDDSG